MSFLFQLTRSITVYRMTLVSFSLISSLVFQDSLRIKDMKIHCLHSSWNNYSKNSHRFFTNLNFSFHNSINTLNGVVGYHSKQALYYDSLV